MSACCAATDAEPEPCPTCGHVGPVVGAAPVRSHLSGVVDGDWQHCAHDECSVVFYLGGDRVEAGVMSTQVGLKAIEHLAPVCFCFAHTRADLAEDLAANDGESAIKASIRAAVADGRCACEHLNPSGKCCLADVHRALQSLSRTESTT